jgi:hypothetical protein
MLSDSITYCRMNYLISNTRYGCNELGSSGINFEFCS